MIPELAHDIFFEIVCTVIVFRFRCIVGSTIGKHPLHVGDVKTLVAVIIGFEPFCHSFLKMKELTLKSKRIVIHAFVSYNATHNVTHKS